MVVKLSDAEGKIAAYDTTDDRGAYSIPRNSLPEAGHRLVFSMLGYATRNITPDDWTRPEKVAMEAAATSIREVVVKAPRISMQGDTVTYNARSFTDADDKTLSDILKKMPGLEVEESGRVKYQGESINKLYIDGVDMLGDRYSLATKNISPQDIKAIDVMENHQPKKILRDVEFSDKAALNIRMDSRIRNQWSGSATAGGGFSPALWNGSLFAMCLSKRFSTMHSAKSDNTGQNIGAEVGITSSGAGYALPQYISVSTSAAPIGQQRTRFNTSHLYNTSNMVRLGDDYSLHVDASYLYERLTSDNASSTTYYVGADSITTRSAARAADARPHARRLGAAARQHRPHLPQQHARSAHRVARRMAQRRGHLPQHAARRHPLTERQRQPRAHQTLRPPHLHAALGQRFRANAAEPLGRARRGAAAAADRRMGLPLGLEHLRHMAFRPLGHRRKRGIHATRALAALVARRPRHTPRRHGGRHHPACPVDQRHAPRHDAGRPLPRR